MSKSKKMFISLKTDNIAFLYHPRGGDTLCVVDYPSYIGNFVMDESEEWRYFPSEVYEGYELIGYIYKRDEE